MSFVPERRSYCIHMVKSKGSALRRPGSRGLIFALDQILMRHQPQTTILNQFCFQFRDTRIKCPTKTRISFGMKTGMTEKYGKKEFLSLSREQVQISGDGMNSSRNEIFSRIRLTVKAHTSQRPKRPEFIAVSLARKMPSSITQTAPNSIDWLTCN